MGNFRRIGLLLAVVSLFVWGGAAWGAAAEIYLANDSGASNGNVGLINKTAAEYQAKVYYIEGSTSSSLRIPLLISTDVADTLAVSSSTGTLSSTSTSISATTSSQSVALTIDSVALSSTPTIKITFTTSSSAAEDLVLTFIPVTLNLTGDKVMSFTQKTAGTKKVTVTATATATPALASPSFDLTLVQESTPIANNTDPWGASVSGLKALLGTDSVSFIGTPSAVKDPATFTVKVTKIAVQGDGNALVLGIGGTTVGTFSAQINSFAISLPPPQTFYLGQLCDVSLDVSVTSGTVLTDLTVSSSDFKGLTLTAYKNEKKIAINGTPSSPDIGGRVTVVGKDSNGATASADLKIIIAQYGLVFAPSDVVTGKTDDVFDKTVNVSVAPDASVVLSDLLVTYDSATPQNSMKWNGLTISADAAGKKITVKGMPDEVESQIFTISATSNSGKVSDAKLAIQVTLGALYTLTLTDSESNQSVANLLTFKGQSYSRVFKVSPTTPTLTLTYFAVIPPGTWNGLTLTSDFATRTVKLEGTPQSTGYHDFIIDARSSTKKIEPFFLRLASVVIGEDGKLIEGDPGKVNLTDKTTGTQASYNGNNFNVGVPYRISLHSVLPLTDLSINLEAPYGTKQLLEGTDYTFERNWNDMSIHVHVTPGSEGPYLLTFSYKAGLEPFTQSIELYSTRKKTSSTDEDSGSSGCGVSSLSVLGLFLLPLLLRKRS